MSDGIESVGEELKTLREKVTELHKELHPVKPEPGPTPAERITQGLIADQLKFEKQIGGNLEALHSLAERVQLIKCRGRMGSFPSWEKLQQERAKLKVEKGRYEELKKEVFSILGKVTDKDFKNLVNGYLNKVREVVEGDSL